MEFVREAHSAGVVIGLLKHIKSGHWDFGFAHVGPKFLSFHPGLPEDQLLLQFLRRFKDDCLFVSLLSHFRLMHCFTYTCYLGICQAQCVQSDQRQPMSAAATMTRSSTYRFSLRVIKFFYHDMNIHGPDPGFSTNQIAGLQVRTVLKQLIIG